jgi:hypothetical protein
MALTNRGGRDVFVVGEDLLARAHAVSQHIQQQVWRLVVRHGLPGPHGSGKATLPGLAQEAAWPPESAKPVSLRLPEANTP